ncbi:MAG: sugar kinase [Chloroflexi bacterium]|nr:sugar kinase [Chloroflexota bacterium]
MSILVVGSVALDSIQTPFGRVTEALGGSATYFSLAATHYAPIKLVAVVGEDFPKEHVELLRQHKVDVEGLQVVTGRTFRWSGRYDFDLNTAITLDTQLNVFAEFHPSLPASYANTPFVFLANIDPELQYEVLTQVRGARLTVMDTMNFWIEGKREALTRTMESVDVVLMNEGELREFAGLASTVKAARKVLELGPKVVICKKGEYGAVLFSPGGYFVAPAYPIEDVFDPTGAGDSFAGGFLGYLASVGDVTPQTFKRAIIHGSVVASFAVEDFSVGRLRSVTRAELDARYAEFRQFTHFDE